MSLLVDKVLPLVSVPLTEGTVLTLQSAAGQAKTVVITNLDLANTLQYKFQFSDDGVNYTDVAPLAAVSPGDSVQTVLTGNIFHRIRALGNLNIAVKASAVLPDASILHLSNI